RRWRRRPDAYLRELRRPRPDVVAAERCAGADPRHERALDRLHVRPQVPRLRRQPLDELAEGLPGRPDHSPEGSVIDLLVGSGTAGAEFLGDPGTGTASSDSPPRDDD